MFAFAISVHSILYPQQEFNFDTILKVMHMGYWTIFGEIYILDDLNKKGCANDPSTCLEPTGIDEQKFAQKYLRELKTLARNTIESKLDVQYEKIKQYDQKFSEISTNRNE